MYIITKYSFMTSQFNNITNTQSFTHYVHMAIATWHMSIKDDWQLQLMEWRERILTIESEEWSQQSNTWRNSQWIIRLRIVSPACQSDEKSKYCKHPTVGCVFYLVILVKNSVRLMKNNTQCPIYVDKQAHSETS